MAAQMGSKLDGLDNNVANHDRTLRGADHTTDDQTERQADLYAVPQRGDAAFTRRAHLYDTHVDTRSMRDKTFYWTFLTMLHIDMHGPKLSTIQCVRA